MDKENEVTIIGAGPAGIAAAIYLKRAGIHPLVLEKLQPGGLLRHAHLVENYPGFLRGITGAKLADILIKHLHKLGVSITTSEVHHVGQKNDTFQIKTNEESFVSSAIIIASGTTPKKIQINGATALEGRQIFYEPFLIPHQRNGRKKRILVIGGGDIAFDYALTILEWGHDVTILSRSEPVCLPLLQKRVLKKKASLHTLCVVEKIRKDRKDLLIFCRKQDDQMELAADFILIACGRDPSISFLPPSLMKYLEDHTRFPQTSLPGLYFAGDVIRGLYRQTGVAVGDGIHAAMMVQNYLKDTGGA